MRYWCCACKRYIDRDWSRWRLRSYCARTGKAVMLRRSRAKASK